MRVTRTFLLLCCLCLSFVGLTQTDTSWQGTPDLSLTGFLDVFYSYDFNRPEDGVRQDFLFNHNRHNAFHLNQGLLGLRIDHPRYRGALGLQAGTYANDNYAAESGVLKNLYEAWAGINLLPGGSLWLDAGIFPSHLGFESVLSIDNWTLTRSLVAESSPFFLAGAKLTWSPDERLDLAFIVTNGWQRIERVAGNSLPSFGTQLVFRPRDGLLFNWSTFIGTDDPDATRRMRYFNNLYAQFALAQNLGLIAGFDFGWQQQGKGSSEYDTWWAPVLIGRLDLSPAWRMAVRLEYYADSRGVIIPEAGPKEFRTFGLSWNVDFLPVEAIAARLEARWFQNGDPIFEAPDGDTSTNVFITASLAVKVERLLGR